MPRKRAPAPKISTGAGRLKGAVNYTPIELAPKQLSQLLQILNLKASTADANAVIRDFSGLCAMAMAARQIYEDTRPKRSYSQSRKPGQRGNPSRHYRAILASDLAHLMFRVGLAPKIIRLDPWEDIEGAAYHKLFQLALEVCGDRSLSDSVRARYLTRGLAIELNPPLNEISEVDPD